MASALLFVIALGALCLGPASRAFAQLERETAFVLPSADTALWFVGRGVAAYSLKESPTQCVSTPKAVPFPGSEPGRFEVRYARSEDEEYRYRYLSGSTKGSAKIFSGRASANATRENWRAARRLSVVAAYRAPSTGERLPEHTLVARGKELFDDAKAHPEDPSRWAAFVNACGSHFVSKALLGKEFRVVLRMRDIDTMSYQQLVAEADGQGSYGSFKGEFSANLRRELVRAARNQNLEVDISFLGKPNEEAMGKALASALTQPRGTTLPVDGAKAVLRERLKTGEPAVDVLAPLVQAAVSTLVEPQPYLYEVTSFNKLGVPANALDLWGAEKARYLARMDAELELIEHVLSSGPGLVEEDNIDQRWRVMKGDGRLQSLKDDLDSGRLTRYQDQVERVRTACQRTTGDLNADCGIGSLTRPTTLATFPVTIAEPKLYYELRTAAQLLGELEAANFLEGQFNVDSRQKKGTQFAARAVSKLLPRGADPSDLKVELTVAGSYLRAWRLRWVGLDAKNQPIVFQTNEVGERVPDPVLFTLLVAELKTSATKGAVAPAGSLQALGDLFRDTPQWGLPTTGVVPPGSAYWGARSPATLTRFCGDVYLDVWDLVHTRPWSFRIAEHYWVRFRNIIMAEAQGPSPYTFVRMNLPSLPRYRALPEQTRNDMRLVAPVLVRGPLDADPLAPPYRCAPAALGKLVVKD